MAEAAAAAVAAVGAAAGVALQACLAHACQLLAQRLRHVGLPTECDLHWGGAIGWGGGRRAGEDQQMGMRG
eukprot:22882-Chlamydomonas_euryale.AAC.2